ncbi:hypothetical protein ABH926_006908 [Catenulispora sp. GP43]|uniref:hypothetical protein n=1 Tax=Catenulispora sp. GP43 TaxID=3156263 RepID=UPI0035152BBD
MAVACLAAACGSGAAKPSAAGSATSSTSSPTPPLSPSTSTSTSTATSTTTTPAGGGVMSPPLIVGTIPPVSIHGARVAELSTVGGNSPFGSLGYLAPEIAVYADGSVVLGSDFWFHLGSADLQTLVSGLQKDLAGQPAALTPSGGAPMPDVGDTVLGVQRAGGGYQTVRANALPRRLSGGAYPAPVVAAYNALAALKTSSASQSQAPYVGTAVRLAYECPVSTSSATQFWPDGLPAPTHAQGTGCPEMVTVSGDAVDLARHACLVYDSALQDGSAAQEVPYLAEGGKGIRTCVWRWALPDEQGH